MQKTAQQHRAECAALFASMEDKHADRWAALAIVGGIIAGILFRVWMVL